jgi:hypothetical protein
VPAHLQELGDDPDGDGVSTEEELRRGTNPLVADFPHLRFHFADLEFGLQIKSNEIQREEWLSVRTTDLSERTHTLATAGVETMRVEGEREMSVHGHAGVHGGPYFLPVSYAGREVRRSQETTERSYASFEVRNERLQQINERIQDSSQKSKKIEIGPDAGFFSGQVTVSASHPCCLQDFTINVFINDRLFDSFPATKDPNFRPLHLGKTGTPDSFRLRFTGLNTQEVLGKVLKKEGVRVTFEAVPGSVKLAEFGPPDQFSKTLTRIQAHCALVDFPEGGTRRCLYVSTAASGGRREIALEELL